MSPGDEQRESETKADEGANLFVQGRYDDALRELEQALSLDPNNVRALGTKAAVLRMHDKPTEAAEVLRRAAKLAPDAAWIYAELGEALRMQGRYEEALEALEKALNRDPDVAFALGTKAAVLYDQGRYEDSLRALEQALALDPDYAFALGVKGSVLAEMDRYEEALAVLGQTPIEDPNYRYMLAVRAEILCDIAYYELALQDINNAIDLGLNNVWTLGLKGWALQNLEDDKVRESLAIYELALQRAPNQVKDIYLRSNYGRALSLLGSREAAEAQYRQAIEKTSKLNDELSAITLANLGWCRYGVGQYTEAVKLFITASSLNKGIIFTQFGTALALMRSGQRRHALREYRLALQLVEGKHILRRRGLLRVALRDLKVAVAEQPELASEPEARRGLGMLEDVLQRTEVSIPQIKEIEELENKGGSLAL